MSTSLLPVRVSAAERTVSARRPLAPPLSRPPSSAPKRQDDDAAQGQPAGYQFKGGLGANRWRRSEQADVHQILVVPPAEPRAAPVSTTLAMTPTLIAALLATATPLSIAALALASLWPQSAALLGAFSLALCLAFGFAALLSSSRSPLPTSEPRDLDRSQTRPDPVVVMNVHIEGGKQVAYAQTSPKANLDIN